MPLAANEDGIRLELAMEIAGLGVFDLDLASDQMTWSPRAAEIYGASAADLGRLALWIERVHPEDRAPLIAFRNGVEAPTGPTDQSLIFRFVRPDGEERWVAKRCRVLRDGAGAAVRISGVIADETELRTSERRSSALTQELQHRVKNILAVVRSLSKQTLQTALTLEDYGSHFDGRLSALARVQSVIIRRGAAGADVEELVREEFLQQATDGEGQLEVRGPQVTLPPKVAETMGLALHELAVNAVKFGALSAKRGHVTVQWTLTEGGAGRKRFLELSWIESGVPLVVTDPSRSGFGRQLIEQGLPYQLDAETSFRLEPGGLRCMFRLPLP